MTPLCLCTFCRLCDECSPGGCGAGCFSPHNRHDSMLQYERNVRAELQADDRAASAHGHGWFTCTAVNHSKHEVSDQGKTVMAAVMAMVEEGKAQAAAPEWGSIPCDVRVRPLRLVPSLDLFVHGRSLADAQRCIMGIRSCTTRSAGAASRTGSQGSRPTTPTSAIRTRPRRGWTAGCCRPTLRSSATFPPLTTITASSRRRTMSAEAVSPCPGCSRSLQRCPRRGARGPSASAHSRRRIVRW